MAFGAGSILGTCCALGQWAGQGQGRSLARGSSEGLPGLVPGVRTLWPSPAQPGLGGPRCGRLCLEAMVPGAPDLSENRCHRAWSQPLQGSLDGLRQPAVPATSALAQLPCLTVLLGCPSPGKAALRPLSPLPRLCPSHWGPASSPGLGRRWAGCNSHVLPPCESRGWHCGISV